MNTFPKKLRVVLSALLGLAVAASMSACGGGSSSTAPAGSAAVGVSVTSAADFPAGTTFASVSAAGPASVDAAAQATFDNVIAAVTRVALIPSTGPGRPDANGQLEEQNGAAEESPSGQGGFVTVTLPAPVEVDLLHPPSGAQVARLLNRFASVPAGTYSKIRVYYDNVVGWSGGAPTVFHPTAHYHFDVHFVGGDLVIPVAADAAGGIRFYSVGIKVVGLKIHQAGNGSVLMRPQVFATVSAPEYLVSGVAAAVNRAAGTFDVVTAGGPVVHAAWGPATSWRFADGRFVAVDNVVGPAALDNGALVDVVGVFQGGVLAAGEVEIAFPQRLTGLVAGGWLGDDTFVLRLPSDNAVIPQPGRSTVVIDNGAFPYERLSDGAISDNAAVTARGYATAGGIRAFWISVGP